MGAEVLCGAATPLPIFWSQIPNIAIVSDTPNRPQYDVGYYLGLYVAPHKVQRAYRDQRGSVAPRRAVNRGLRCGGIRIPRASQRPQ